MARMGKRQEDGGSKMGTGRTGSSTAKRRETREIGTLGRGTCAGGGPVFQGGARIHFRMGGGATRIALIITNSVPAADC
jgi:hypothetical protein